MSIIQKFLLLSLLFICTNANANTIEYKSIERKFNTKNGLPQVQITNLFKDSRGFVWIGTRNGIARWDGKKMKSFVNEDYLNYYAQSVELINELDDQAMFFLYYIRNSKVNFSIINGDRAQYFSFKIGNKPKNIHPIECKIAYEKGNVIKLAFLIDNVLYEYDFDRLSKKMILKNKIYDIAHIHYYAKKCLVVSKKLQSKDSILFIAYDSKKKLFEKPIDIKKFDNFQNISFRNYQSSGSIYLNSNTKTVYRLNISKKNSIVFDSFYVDFNFKKLVRSSNTNNGIVLQSMDSICYFNFLKSYKTKAIDVVRDFIYDNEGNLYVGTEHGLNCYYNSGIEEGSVNDSSDFDYFIFINKLPKGPYVFSSITKGLMSLNSNNVISKIKFPNFKTNIAFGRVVGNQKGDILYPVIEKSKIPIFTNSKMRYYDFNYNGLIYGVKLNPYTNDIFISIGNNLIKFDSKSKKIVKISNKILDDKKYIFDFDFKKTGEIILKDEFNMYVLKDNKVTYENKESSNGWSVLIDTFQSIWFSVGKTLCVLKKDQKYWLKNFPSKNPIISLGQIKNKLVIGTLHELIFLDLALWNQTGIENYIMYSVYDHLNIKEGNQNNFFIENDSIFYWPCLDKLLKFNVNKILSLSHTPPKVVLLEYVFYNQKIQLNVFDTFGQKEYLIPSSIRNIDVKFTCPTYLNHNNIQYRYRINKEGEWLYIKSNELIRIFDITSGTYQIEIQASFDGVTWNESKKSLPIVFQPLFYETYMFWAISLLLLVFFGYLVVRYFMNKLKKIQKDELKKKIEKNSLSLQVIKSKYIPHFTFNAMTSINYLLRKQEVKKASSYLVKMTELQRIALSNFDNPETSLETELKFLSHYLALEGLRFEDTLSYRIVVGKNVKLDTQIPNLSIHTMVENAIKHGLYNKPDGNWKLAVYVLQLKDKLVISVEDNGLGLDKANENKTHSTGSGLRMLKKQLKILSNHAKKYTYRLSDIYDSKRQIRGARSSIFITSY